MKDFYEKLLKLRDTISPNSQENRNKIDFLSKLMVEAFENGDELPKNFYLLKVFIDEDEAKDLLTALGFNAEVDLKNDSYIGGRLFKIKIQ